MNIESDSEMHKKEKQRDATIKELFTKFSTIAGALDLQSDAENCACQNELARIEQLTNELKELKEYNANLKKEIDRDTDNTKFLMIQASTMEKTCTDLKNYKQMIKYTINLKTEMIKKIIEEKEQMRSRYRSEFKEISKALESSPLVQYSIKLDNQIKINKLETTMALKQRDHLIAAYHRREHFRWVVERANIVKLAEFMTQLNRNKAMIKEMEEEIARLKRESLQERISELKRRTSEPRASELRVSVAPVRTHSPPKLTPLLEMLPADISSSIDSSLNSIDEQTEPTQKKIKIIEVNSIQTANVNAAKTADVVKSPLGLPKVCDTQEKISQEDVPMVVVSTQRNFLADDTQISDISFDNTCGSITAGSSQIDVSFTQMKGKFMKKYQITDSPEFVSSKKISPSIDSSLKPIDKQPEQIQKKIEISCMIKEHKQQEVRQFAPEQNTVKTVKFSELKKSPPQRNIDAAKKIEVLESVILNTNDTLTIIKDMEVDKMIEVNSIQAVNTNAATSADVLKSPPSHQKLRDTQEKQAKIEQMAPVTQNVASTPSKVVLPPTHFQDEAHLSNREDVPMVVHTQTNFLAYDTQMSDISFDNTCGSIAADSSQIDISFTQMKEEIMNKYQITASPEFVYSKKVDKPIVSKFFATKDQDVGSLEMESKKIVKGNVAENHSEIKPSKSNEVFENVKDINMESENTKSMDVNVKSGQDLDESNYDFTSMLDTPSALLSPRPDEQPMDDTSQPPVANLFGIQKTAFLTTASNEDKEKESQSAAFNFNFQTDKKKSGFFSLFQ